MKKIFTFIFALIFTSFAFAELSTANRHVEIGFEAEGGFSNNYFTAKEFLVKDLVIDLNEIANKMPDNGLVLDFNAHTKTWVALNLSQKFKLNLFYGIEGTGYANVSKNFFELLCNGVELNSHEVIDLSVFGDIYAHTGVTFETQIKKFGIHLTPAFFAPIVHVAETTATVNYTSTADGLMRAEADLPLNIYTLVNLDGIKDKDIDSAYMQEVLAELVKSAGFDFAFEVDHSLGEKFTLGAFTRIPIVPGRLKYKTSVRYWGVAEQKNALGILDETNSYSSDYGHDDAVYSRETKIVHRPFILGLEAAWKPFGSWCTLYPKVNLAVRNPYTSENQVYGEYSLSGNFSLFNVLGLQFGTAYENLVFKQTAGFMVNCRVVELDGAIMFRGADFAKSFGVSGLGAYLGVKVGW